MADKKTKEEIPKVGDMIAFPRTGYDHFAFFSGGGKVIHATSDSKASGSVIKEESLDKVANGGHYRVSNQDHMYTPLKPEESLKLAKGMIGKKFDYNPVSKNCETFASGMRYGNQGFSLQGDKIIQSATAAGTSFLSHAKETHNNFEGN